jgi:hypothetical protein
MVDNSYLAVMCSIMDGGCEAIHGPWTHRSERYAEMAAPRRRVVAPGISAQDHREGLQQRSWLNGGCCSVGRPRK